MKYARTGSFAAENISARHHECPWCMAVLVAGTEICSVCGESNKMAVLECLHPIGDISSGASWSLYPRSYTVGSGTAADIVLTGAQVPDVTFSLKYMGGVYHIDKLERPRVSKIKMDDSQIGFLIQIGEGAFTLQYVAGMRYSDYMEVAPQALERAFSAACQMLDVDDISLVYERALDAVLRITGFEKGYYFSIEDTELTMESARRLDMSYLDMRFCSFSQMSIQDAIARNDIYLMNVENDGSGNMTKSMQVLGLRKTMCVPVGDGNSRPSGAIYADTQRNTLLSPALFKPALRMLSKMVAFKLRSFGTGNLQQKEDIYDR